MLWLLVDGFRISGWTAEKRAEPPDQTISLGLMNCGKGSEMKRLIVAGTFALACSGCASQALGFAPECLDVRARWELDGDSTVLTILQEEDVRTGRPRVLNLEEMLRAMRRAYPPQLKTAGIGGFTTVWALVTDEGCVVDSLVKIRSGSEAMDAAALKVMRVVRFEWVGEQPEPGTAGWVEIPLVFTAN